MREPTDSEKLALVREALFVEHFDAVRSRNPHAENRWVRLLFLVDTGRSPFGEMTRPFEVYRDRLHGMATDAEQIQADDQADFAEGFDPHEH